MIVLDATNKSLKIQPVSVPVTIVVSYWSIASSVWTPRRFDIEYGSGINAFVTLLHAPSAGETKVVENIWIHLNSTLQNATMNIILSNGAAERRIGSIGAGSTAVPGRTTFTMSRNGEFTRQIAILAESAVVTQTQNVH